MKFYEPLQESRLHTGTDQGKDTTLTFGKDHNITSDNRVLLQQFIDYRVDISCIQNIIDSRKKHLIEFLRVEADQFDQLVKDAGKNVQDEWGEILRLLKNGYHIKGFNSFVPKNALLSATHIDGQSSSYWNLERIVRLLSLFVSTGCEFLEFGSTFGDIGIYFAHQCKVTFFNLPGETYEFAKFHTQKSGVDIRFLNDLKNIKDNSYDIVCVQNVLERTENPMDIVIKLLRSLKPEGYLVTSGFSFDSNIPGHLPFNMRYQDSWVADFIRMGQKYICKFNEKDWFNAVFEQTMTYSHQVVTHTPTVPPQRHSYNLLSDEFVMGWDRALEKAASLNIQHPYPPPEVSIVIPSMNRKEPLLKTIDKILNCSTRTAEIIIVDDSTDGSHESIADHYTQNAHVIIIHNEKRLGILPSVNLGLGVSVGQYIVMISDDLEVFPEWETNLIFLLNNEPLCGAVVPLILNPDGTIHRMGTIDGVRSAKYLLPPVYGAMGYNALGKKPSEYPECQWVRECESGQMYMTTRQMLEKVGGLDERYTKYMADIDFGMRIRLAGYKVLYCPRSIIKFREPSSSSHDGDLLRLGIEMHQKKWETYTVRY